MSRYVLSAYICFTVILSGSAVAQTKQTDVHGHAAFLALGLAGHEEIQINRAEHCEQPAPPNRRMQIGEHGGRWAREFVDAGRKNQQAINQENNAYEEPDRNHVTFLVFRVHQIKCGLAGWPFASAPSAIR